MARAAIHFTHHLCRTIDPTAVYPSDCHDEYRRIWPNANSPDWVTSRCVVPSPRARFVTEPKRVTCRRCIRWLERESECHAWWLEMTPDERAQRGQWASRPGHAELVKRAWRLCCAKRGVPSPLNDEDRAQLELDRLTGQLKDVAGIGLSLDLAVMKHQSGGPTAAAWFRDHLAELASNLDPRIRALAQPLFERWMFVGDLLVHVGDAIDEAQKLVEPLARAVCAAVTAEVNP